MVRPQVQWWAREPAALPEKPPSIGNKVVLQRERVEDVGPLR